MTNIRAMSLSCRFIGTVSINFLTKTTLLCVIILLGRVACLQGRSSLCFCRTLWSTYYGHVFSLLSSICLINLEFLSCC